MSGPVLVTRPELAGTFGMVATTHWLATAAGMALLEGGGNAADAAVAAGFALQVVEPHLNGPGGEVAILVAGDGQPVRVLCGQGPAPAAATPETFAALGLGEVPATGILAACVPGAFDAWLLLLRDWGTAPLRQVLEPAIGYAEHGAPLLASAARAIRAARAVFESAWPTSAALWLPGGVSPRAGARFANPALAATYRRLLDVAEGRSRDRDTQIEEARQEWRTGFVAEAIARYAATEVDDGTGRRRPALLTERDLAGWSASVEDPVCLEWRDRTVCKTGPWGQGPVLLQQLQLLEVDGGRSLTMSDGQMTADAVHAVVECAKLAFADREAWYGDPDFVHVPLVGLLSPSYAEARRALVEPTASTVLRPGQPGELPPQLPSWCTMASADDKGTGAPGVGEPTARFDRPLAGDTCHLDVVDRRGLMVSATPSGGWLQSSPVVPGVGFPLGTRLQMAWLEGGLANTLVPGKRPRTTLSPTLVLRDGVAVLAFGTPGGDQQDQWPLVFLLAHVLGRLDLQEALDSPVWHTTAVPSSFVPHVRSPAGLVAEASLPSDVFQELAARGHQVEVVPAWSLGRTTAVARDPRGGVLRAGANARGRQAYAAGR